MFKAEKGNTEGNTETYIVTKKLNRTSTSITIISFSVFDRIQAVDEYLTRPSFHLSEIKQK